MMVLIRADGNAKIGEGHIMRCLSVARAFRKDNVRVMFAMADDTFQTFLEGEGFMVRVLNSRYDRPEEELVLLRRIISENGIRLCLFDSYYMSEEYFASLTPYVKTAYMDDLVQAAFPVDILINYNLYADQEAYLTLYRKAGLQSPQLLLGCGYVPLRAEFEGVIRKERTEKDRILVLSGGADPEHSELRLLTEITDRKERFGQYLFQFVAGAMNGDWQKLKELADKNENVILHRNVTNMSELMQDSDVAVSAAGSTLYELSACGVPVVTFVTADNQIPGAERFGQSGHAVYAGDVRSNGAWVEKALAAAEEILKDPERHREMSAQGQSLVDGQGAARIAGALLSAME